MASPATPGQPGFRRVRSPSWANTSPASATTTSSAIASASPAPAAYPGIDQHERDAQPQRQHAARWPGAPAGARSSARPQPRHTAHIGAAGAPIDGHQSRIRTAQPSARYALRNCAAARESTTGTTRRRSGCPRSSATRRPPPGVRRRASRSRARSTCHDHPAHHHPDQHEQAAEQQAVLEAKACAHAIEPGSRSPMK